MRSYEDLPIVFSCANYILDRILKSGLGILSKQELERRNIPFIRSTTSPRGLEHLLGTNDNVALYVDRTFERGNIYAGMGCSRIIFDESLLFRDDVFVLPIDQYMYDPRREDSWYQRFETDKRKTKEEKIALLEEYRQSDGKIPLEVHVPHCIELKWWKMVLMYINEVSKYESDPRLAHVEIRPFGFSNLDVFKPHMPAFRAYFELSSSQ